MTESEERQWVIKLAVLGDSGVGKTSLINQYIQHSFTADYLPTLGVNIVIKDIKIKRTNTLVRLTLWDIAGQEKYDLTRRLFFQGCEGVLLVYDITRPLTFDNIKYKWLKEFKKFTDKDCIYILIGNKVDLRDEGTISIEDRLNIMSFEKGKKFASSIKASNFIETSAKLGDNVEKAFEALYKQVLRRNGAEI
jgi:small GTP-binding protein